MKNLVVHDTVSGARWLAPAVDVMAAMLSVTCGRVLRDMDPEQVAKRYRVTPEEAKDAIARALQG